MIDKYIKNWIIKANNDIYIPDMKEVRFYYELAKQIKELITVKLGIKE